MKAVVCTRYGPPEALQLRELEKPAPKHDEVRIKIHATAVTSSDCIVRSFNLPALMWIPARLVLGITRPSRPVLGMVLAGEIEAVGKDVSSFKDGDQVYGFDRFAFGAYAEYKCMPESGVLASKPSSLSYEEAAAIPHGGLLALYFLRRAKVRSGQRVLVYGASGAVGDPGVDLEEHDEPGAKLQARQAKNEGGDAEEQERRVAGPLYPCARGVRDRPPTGCSGEGPQRAHQARVAHAAA